MPLAFIRFDESLGFWSPLTFWVVIVSVILTLGFTAVIFIGGIGDLRFLLRSLDGTPDDHSDPDEPPKDQSH